MANDVRWEAEAGKGAGGILTAYTDDPIRVSTLNVTRPGSLHPNRISEQLGEMDYSVILSRT